MKGAVFQPSSNIADLLVEALKLIRRHVVAVAVDSDGIVECLDILEDQGVGLGVGLNPEAIQPFPLDQGVEGFDAGIVIGVTLVAVAQLELLRSFPVCLGNVLTTPIAVIPNSV